LNTQLALSEIKQSKLTQDKDGLEELKTILEKKVLILSSCKLPIKRRGEGSRAKKKTKQKKKA